LLAEVSDEDLVPYELPSRIRCDELEEFMKKQKIDVRSQQGKEDLRRYIEPIIPDAQKFVDKLADFMHTDAKLPTLNKNFQSNEPIKISVEQSREQIIEYLQQLRPSNPTADFAFYAYRDMETCDWAPFVKAAVERNPVSIRAVESMSLEQIYTQLKAMKNNSIYDGKRLAQPDEIVNYQIGDGLEKAFLLTNIIRARHPGRGLEVVADRENVVLKEPREYRFVSTKGLIKHIRISAAGAIKILE